MKGRWKLYQFVDSTTTVETVVGRTERTGHPTHHIHSGPIEMNILALDHADHHPAEWLQVMGISPHDVTLTYLHQPAWINSLH